jgi:predicted lipoprotein with Yx(FWY)xxD motif
MTVNRVVMMLGVAGALSLAACGSSSSSAKTTATPSTTAAPSASGGTTLKVVSTTSRGDVLVDGAGKTLYLFEKDSGTTSACTGGCAKAWPALSATSTVTGSTGIDAGKLGSAHGQVTYNGHLLYYFSGDAAPGDMNGVSIDGWYPVTPAGGSAEPK